MRKLSLWLIIFVSPTLGVCAGVLLTGQRTLPSKHSEVPRTSEPSVNQESGIQLLANPIELSRNTVLFDDTANEFICDSACFFAAVDKKHPLPADFEPATGPTGLPGGNQLTEETTAALAKLFGAASDAGIAAEISSGYRSHALQGRTFKNWIDVVSSRDKSLTKAQVILEANRISALPGHSEHQLGTTVDVNTVGQTALDRTSNRLLYDFIEKNAHLYGFVVTYPESSEELTGYQHEPWHIRYLGVDLAAEILATGYLSGNGNSSTQYLRDNRYSH